MCRVLFTVALLIAMAPGHARGDLPDEHPEWFGYTAPIEGVGPLGWIGTKGRIWIAPTVGDSYHLALLGALRPGAAVTILAQGGQGQLDLYTWMDDEGLEPAQHGWIDVEVLDTAYAGEWGPVALRTENDEAILLDGRYYSLRPSDDAAPGRIATIEDAPLHRIPLFLSAAHLQGTGDGLCVAGPEIYNMNVGHTAAEIDYALREYAGCAAIIALPAPSEEFKKKPMDLYVRLTGAKASADAEAWGVFLGDASGWSLSLQEGQDAIRGVLEAAGGAGTTAVIDVPWPETKDGTIRSYLPFVALEGALVLPTYMGMPTTEEGVREVLAQELGDVAIRAVPADLAAALEAWPSRLIAGGAGGPWAEVPAPEQLCASGDPSDCAQCLSECGEVETTCVVTADGPTLGGCVVGADGCLDRLFEPCPEGKICEDGACADPPTTCETLPPGGICEDNVVVKCVGGQLVEVDCSPDFHLCGYEETGEAACFAPCGGGCQIPGETRCGDGEAGILLTCTLGPEGCPEWVESLCPDGQRCDAGVCTETVLDVVEGVDGVEDLDAGGDGPAITAGYSGKDGCGVRDGPASPAGLLLLLLAGTILRRFLYKRLALP
jgi:hypothetical protein